MNYNINVRITELLSESGITPEQFARDVGVSARTVSQWLNHATNISFNNLLKICARLNCSIDFLAGRTVNAEPLCEMQENRFFENFEELLFDKKIDLGELADKLNMTRSHVYKWAEGKAKPSLYSLRLLADVFNMPIDWLVF